MASPIEKSRENRFRARVKLRPASARKSRLRRIALENLEPRTLLAVLPPAVHDSRVPNPVAIDGSSGDHSTATVAVDPNDPMKLAAAWVRFDPPNLPPPIQSLVEAAYSTNGGLSWTLLSVPGPIGDPTTTNPVQPFPTTTDPSIGFDRNGNFYLLVDEHNAATSAALVLFKWSEASIAAGSTMPGQTTRVLYTDQEVPTAPIVAVDTNVSSFTDPSVPTVTQTDIFSNNVYVAWAANDTAPANVTDLSRYNPNRIRIVASSTGGASFGPVQTLDSTGISGLQRYATPRLAISQGRVGLPGGQVSAVWDDFGSGANFSPIPLDFVDSNRIQGGISQGFASGTGVVADGIDPGNSAPHIPVTTTFLIPVTVDPRFTTLSDLDFTINLLAANLADLQIQLQAPNGTTVTLMRNQVDASNTLISQFIGSTGANLGINGNGFTLGTTFDQEATRALVDINAQFNGRGAAAPYIGPFRPDGGNLTTFNGMNRTAVNGTWRLLITDVRNDGAPPPPQFLLNGTLRLTSGMSRGTQTTVTNTTVRGAAPTATSAYPLGITPQATIASDNTLGAFSPFQGRLYIAYVDRFDDRRDGGLANGNPADNTDIFLVASDNGGQTWSAVHNFFGLPAPVNDDSAIRDGFSEGTSLSDIFSRTTSHMNGRPQFQPAIAVDQNTGTLVLSYYDARYDAARARVSTTIAASIDGGATFGKQAFANAPELAFEEITRQDVVLGPIPDNQSGGNPKTEGTFSYGPRQGLAVEAGHVYPVWSSNENGGQVTGNGSLRLDIRVAPMDIAAGPRVISSTMGPVGLPGDVFNNTPAADGTPQARAFQVTFDRPVDPNTVSASNGLPQNTVFLATFENGADGFTTDNSGPDGVAGTADDGLWHLSTGRGNDAGHSAVTSMYYGQGEGPSGGGNYNTGVSNAGAITSPPIALPTGRSLSLSFQYFLGTEGDANFFDQARVTVLDLTRNSSTVIAQNNTGNLLDPSNGFQTFSTDLTPFAGDTVQLVFSFDTEDSLFNNFEGWYIDDVSVFQTAVPPNLQIVARDASGVLLPVQPVVQNVSALNPTQFGATTFLISFTPQSTEGTYSYSVGSGVSDRIRTPLQSGNRMDQNTNAVAGESPVDIYAAPRPLSGTPFQAPYDSNTLPLIVPGPHVVSSRAVLGSNGQEASPSADNLVTNDTATGLDVVFDRNMEPNLATPTFTPAQVLRIMGPAGPINGPFTITPNPNNSDPDPTHPRTFRIGFPTQELSGTYTVVLGPSIQDVRGNFVDANLNAGLDALRGNPTTGLTAPITFNSTAVPVNITPGRTVTSTIDVTDNFVIQDLDLRLNITHSNDPDLEAALIAPDGVTTIKLFTKVGAIGTRANFTNTVFDDAAATPIQNGGPPFFGSFNPQEPLSLLNGTASAGRYTLQIKNNSTTNTGILNSWSLTFRKPLPGTGMGEPVADRTSLGFRIFTMDPTNPLASNTWTAVGPASIGGGASGRIGGLALDPSDPSGNTVYVGGASGGVWKTTNFLTTDPIGPTYIPLTDFGPTFAINIGSIAVFGRNDDPNQSIVFAATGEGDTSSRGVGVLRSLDGGATWTILDSSTNVDAAGKPLPITSPLRDHAFVGTTSFKIVVDPKPTVSGETIVYLAISGGNGGIWRSLDTGKHWQRMRGGQATEVVLDPNSGFLNAVSNPTGNLQIVYAGFRGEGVFISSNQGQGWALMAGGGGDPLIQDADFSPPPPVAVNAPSNTPNGAKGRIELAKPFLTGNPLEDLLYEGWLYAAVVATDNHLDGLYLTKDFGRNWTKIRLPNQRSALASSPNLVEVVPSNNIGLGDYDPLGGPVFAQGNYDVSLAIDPTNPNVVYLGGTRDGQPSGLIRVDATAISDPYSLYLSNSNPDGGALRAATTDPATLEMPTRPPLFYFPLPFVYDPRFDPRTGDDRGQLNFIQDPANPFVIGATHYVTNTTRFANSGANVKWIPFDAPLAGTTDQHRVFSFEDPTTGHARLVFGDDQGVFTGVDAGDGTLIQSLGSVSDLSNPNGDVPVVTGSRNGNLQITQFYYGAAQPSNLAAQIAVLRGMFYGSAQDDGFPISDPNIINDPTQPGYGNITWNGPGGDGGGVATDQTGTGTVYNYKWPCCGGNITDFFQVNDVGRTTGLLQQSQPGLVPDPQWPFLGVINFAINPLNGDQAIISSAAGRIFRTETQGRFWLPIADPSTLDGAQSLALAYGAPDPNAPGGVGSLDNFIYIGTEAGHIFVTFTGGGSAGNQWTDISAGLDRSSVKAIVTNPTRSSHEAYAVTTSGVFHMVDSAAGGATWQNITSNLFQVSHKPFADSSLTENQLSYLSSIQADWRYVIPDDFSNPSGPTHPMLYVGGEGGVYRSLDKGQTWIHFPDVALLNTLQEPSGANQPVNVDREGGYLPDAHVTDLDLSLGNINPTTGRPDVATGPNILLASTYGRGSFAIRLAPIVFPNTPVNPTALHFDPNLPNPPGPPNGSDSGTIGDGITNVTNPVIDGLSEESAFGNLVRITLIDLTNPNNPVQIPIVAGTDQTDSVGRFAVQVAPGYFKSDGSTDGPKVIGVQAINASGTKGNIALFNFTLNTNRPGKPGAPDLEAASDSGLSNTDDITNVASGAVFDVLPSGPNQIAQNVELLRDGVMVATVQIPSGPVSMVKIADSGPVPDGQHVYTALQVDIAGNVSPPSDPLTVTFDTGAPNTPAIPTLDPNDDTGVKGDGQTKVRQPHLIGTLVPESVDPVAQVQIVSTTGAILGTATSAANGSYSVQFASPLADAVYAIKIQAEDVAGNLSGLSPVFVLRINNKLPTTPTIVLFAADDSGVKGDNITNVLRPRLVGVTDPNLNVDLIDTLGDVSGTAGMVLATAISDNNGNYVVQFPANLPDKVYHIQTQARDAADNKALSPTLVLAIDTTPPAIAPTLGIDPNDDTGVLGDGVTTKRRPHLVGVTEPGGVVEVIDNAGNVLAITLASPSTGAYSTQLASDLNNGVVVLRARATDPAGNRGPTSAPFNLTVITVADDYDADGRADLVVFRPTTGQWFISQSTDGGKLVPFGAPGDVPLQGDFDGDGKTDVAVFHPATATWSILRSQLGLLTIQFGQVGVDVPVPADYDGDGRTDLAVYRPTTAQWFIIRSSAGGEVIQLGQAGVDRPEPGDYDGDGKSDLAVYRPTTGQWFISQSTAGGKLVQLGGQAGDLAVPGAYDGNLKTEVAIFRPSTAQWLINGPTSVRTIQFGAPNSDLPVPQDYDGDSKTDLAVFRPNTAQWFILASTTGGRIAQFGAANLDIPVPVPVDARIATFGFQTRAAAGSNGSGSDGGSDGLRSSSFDFGGLASGLAASGSTAVARSAALSAPAVITGPTSSAPGATTTAPATSTQPPATSTGQLLLSTARRRPITVVQHPSHQPVDLPRHHGRAQHLDRDAILAAALRRLGRIKAGRFLPTHEA